MAEQKLSQTHLSDAYQMFLERPSRESFIAARQRLLSRMDFERDSFELELLADLCRDNDLDQAVDLAEQIFDLWCLSPRYHFVCGHLWEQLDCPDEVELARFQFETCLEGLLSSGTGSFDAPYQILRVCDEYDVLEAQKQRPICHRSVDRFGACLDVITCEGGAETWFDSGLRLPEAKTWLRCDTDERIDRISKVARLRPDALFRL